MTNPMSEQKRKFDMLEGYSEEVKRLIEEAHKLDTLLDAKDARIKELEEALKTCLQYLEDKDSPYDIGMMAINQAKQALGGE